MSGEESRGRWQPPAWMVWLVAALCVGASWWSWHAVGKRDDDRTRVENRPLAAVPATVCGGLVRPDDVAALRDLRADGPLTEARLSLPTAAQPGLRCDVTGKSTVRVEALPLAEADPTWLQSFNAATVPSGVPAGLASERGAWVVVGCPGGDDRRFFARAVYAKPDGSLDMLLPHEVDAVEDTRAELAALARNTAAAVAERAGCGAVPPGPPPQVPYPPLRVDRAKPAADPACDRAADGLPTHDTWSDASGLQSQCSLHLVPPTGNGGGWLNQSISAFRGPLSGVGTRAAADLTAFRSTDPVRWVRYRTEAVCGDVPVSWIVHQESYGTVDAPNADDAGRRAYQRFLDYQRTTAGCRLVSGEGSGR
ncbi:hypothetical protein [Yinghuangia seranimata]|uniref:hypothetical protein n=1 Tax=Yinghuangia seranimata TaxID=408067 RepID=UPI00248D116C|nr:hypothetical protein [Yinghuangia seranimata]MDI2131340.1 hypothetical protein [Yinghuangia seranimata]